MPDTPLNRTVIGVLIIGIGIVLTVFHRKIRVLGDRMSEQDPLLRQGDWWTGKYTRGGLIYTHASIVIIGLLCIVAGVLLVLGVVGL